MKLEDRPFVRGIVLRWKDLQRGVMRKLECGHIVAERDGGRAAQAKTAVCTTCKWRSYATCTRPPPGPERERVRKAAAKRINAARTAQRKTQPSFSWARVWAKYGVQVP